MQKPCTARCRCPRRNDATDSLWGGTMQMFIREEDVKGWKMCVWTKWRDGRTDQNFQHVVTLLILCTTNAELFFFPSQACVHIFSIFNKETLPVRFRWWFKLRRDAPYKMKERRVGLGATLWRKFYWDLCAEGEVCSLLTGSVGDQLSRSVTLSEVSRFCQVFWHPASVVLRDMELLRFFFFFPKRNWEKK